MKLEALASLVLGMSLLTAHVRPADACGVKLTVKMAAHKGRAAAKTSNKPVRANEPRPIVTAKVVRTPVAAGPGPERKVVAVKQVDANTKQVTAAKEPEPPPPPPPEKTEVVAVKEPAKEPVKQPDPAPPVEKTVPKQPEPKKVVATTQPKVETVAPQGDLNSEVYFGLGSATVVDTKKIEKAAKWLADHPDASILVEGHADPSGNSDLNLTLSQSRADAVRDALVSAGVDTGRIEVQAFGDTKPRYGKADARNRRVHVHVK